MSDYAATTTQEGWGQELGQYFISKVTIDNQAQPGANIQTFYSGRWQTLIGNVQAGDFVMAAFGINDSGTTHGPVAVPAFQAQMVVMAGEVAAKKATFIPTTSSPLQVWVNGVETNTRLQPYVDATLAVGTSLSLPVDNLNAAGVAYYNQIGQTAAAALTFNGDKAHFDKQGATEMALFGFAAIGTDWQSAGCVLEVSSTAAEVHSRKASPPPSCSRRAQAKGSIRNRSRGAKTSSPERALALRVARGAPRPARRAMASRARRRCLRPSGSPACAG